MSIITKTVHIFFLQILEGGMTIIVLYRLDLYAKGKFIQDVDLVRGFIMRVLAIQLIQQL